MRKSERFLKPNSTVTQAVGCWYKDTLKAGSHIRGDVSMTMVDGKTGEIQQEWEKKNIVVMDASILIARLLKNNQEPPSGIFALAVGTGDVGWNPLVPPAATNTQRSLYAELTRKTFSNTQFIDGGGNPTAIPTNIVDYTTQFVESEAVGGLVEMGLIGGNISTNLAVRNPVSPPNGPYDPLEDLTTKETLINYLTFPIMSKPATSVFTITWRLTF